MLDEVISHLKNSRVVIISEDKLESLFNEVEVVEEQDTYFRDMIRILEKDDILMIQEKSNKDEILIRKIESRQEGQKFIQDRLAIYENMWNGCGCKIDYYK
jgi:hypothetical protein